jgi:D-lactate dehydrogenase
LACPVHIDTGKFVKTWRANELESGNKKVANYIGSHMAGTTSIVRTGLKAVSFFHSILGNTIMTALSTVFHYLTFKTVPKWIPEMPKAANKINAKN